MSTPDTRPGSEDAATRKRALRARCREALSRLTGRERDEAAGRLRERLSASTELAAARRIMAYMALPSEPDVLPSLVAWAASRSGNTLYLPRWNPGTLEYEPAAFEPGAALAVGPFGVPEPGPGSPGIPDAGLDLILVPGLAFDRQGRRLGRGRGFYDRLLARAGAARRWGVGFDLQIVDEVPSEAHDVSLHLLATPGSWIPTSHGSSSFPKS